MVTSSKAKRNVWQNQLEKTHRPFLSMLTADLRHFVPNRTSLQITTFSFCSNQLPEELIDPKVFQIRSFSIAFWPMRFDSCQPSWSNGMARRSDDKTWGRQTWWSDEKKLSQSSIPGLASIKNNDTLSPKRNSYSHCSIYSRLHSDRREGNDMKISSKSADKILSKLGTANDVWYSLMLWALQVREECKKSLACCRRQPIIQGPAAKICRVNPHASILVQKV